MNDAIQCPHCKKIFFAGLNDICPFCNKNINCGFMPEWFTDVFKNFNNKENVDE